MNAPVVFLDMDGVLVTHGSMQAAPQESGPALPASPAEAPAATALASDAPPAPSAVGTFEAVTTASALPVAVFTSFGGDGEGTFTAPRATRADAILSVLTDRPQRHRQIVDAAARLGVPLGSVGMALSELLRRGLAAQDSDGRYFRVGNEPRSAKLPHGELQRRVLAALADGPRHVDDLVEPCGTTRASVELTANAMTRQGVLERCAAATWRVAIVVPVRLREPTSEPAPSMTPPPAVRLERIKVKGKRRSTTLAKKWLSRHELAAGAELAEVDTTRRPKTRADCVDGPRPCPFVACKHNLYLDVSPDTGSIKLNFPDVDPLEMRQSCALDIADQGGVTLEAVADALALTRERARQIETQALLRVRKGGSVSAEDARGLGREEVA